MIFNVRVTARASRNRIEQNGFNLKVYLTKPASEDLANAQLIDTFGGIHSSFFMVQNEYAA